MNKRTDLLANMKTMVTTREISDAAVLSLDSHNERSEACLSALFVCEIY